MSEPILPIPTSRLPEQAGPNTTGEGAQTALAAMIRKRKMAENRVDDEPGEAAPKQIPGA
jgi:hypothetical protein